LGWETPLEEGTASCFPCSSVGKESACSAGDPCSIPELGRFPGEGNSNPLQYASKFGNLNSGCRTGKGFIPVPKKGIAKECSNYCTIILISPTSKVMFKMPEARFQ